MNIYKVIGWTDWDGDDYPVNKGSVATDLAVIECIRKNGYAFWGDSHQNRKGCCPVLNDGTKVRYSMRGWGSIMASALDIVVRLYGVVHGRMDAYRVGRS